MTLLIAFITVWALSPGPVAVMTIHKTHKQGASAGLSVAAGATLTSLLMVIAALLVHIIGLDGAQSSPEFMIIERLGAVAIIAMGLYAGYKNLSPKQEQQDDKADTSSNNRASFTQGMLMMATYIPQAIIFYTVIVPQSSGLENITQIILGLGTLKVFLIWGWHSLIAIMATKAQRWLDNRFFAKGLDVATACLLVGLGINILI